MKKIAGIVLKSLAGLILLILILLFTVPIIFKEKIKTKVEKTINGSINATVTFSDYKLSFFRSFPNLSFSLKNMYVSGIDKFAGDTLAGFKSFDIVFNLASLLSSSGYEIKSVIIDQAVINAIVLKDGKANWDIVKPSTAPEVPEPTAKPSGMKILLKKFEIRKSSVKYSDESMGLLASLNDINFTLKGNMSLGKTDLALTLNTGDVTVTMDGVKYLNKVYIESKIDLKADLDSMKFTIGTNYLSINDLRLNFSGMVAMPKNDIRTDLLFSTEKTSFKTLLSLVPAVYIKGYEDLKASGDFKLDGSAIGVYSESDSTLPDLKINLLVYNGIISYPALPEKISNINISADVSVDGKILDKTTVNIEKFHFELAGSPFDMTFFMKTPISDPDFKGSMNGRLDLSALAKAVPIEGTKLTGIIDMAVSMAGRLSMIEKQKYDSFTARGTMGIRDMVVAMKGYPQVDVRNAEFVFTPAYTQMQKADLVIAGKSDFSISGNVENYIPYIFRNQTIKGSMILHSKVTDASSILNALSPDTLGQKALADKTAAKANTTSTDTTSLAVVKVPKNIDFDFNALIDKFSYSNIKAENVKGHIIVRNGILSVRETGMNILGGTILMSADYDTRDTLKPVMKADIGVKNIGVKDAFNTFVTIQKFAPTAKGIEGKFNAQLTYESLLGRDMMPVLNTINGAGKIQSDQIQLLESASFDKLKEVLKLGSQFSNTFKNINVSFKINNGRVFVSPFDVKLSNIKMNISGDQGLDQTINYIVKTEIPRSDLGNSINSLIDNVSAQAAAFGIKFKPADILKINVKVSGTFTKPVVAPYFGSTTGSGPGSVQETAKETIKQTIDNSTDKAKEKLREEAATQGDKLIKEAETRGQQLRDEAGKAAQKLRQEADSSAAKLIKSAEPKGVLYKAGAQKGADALKKEAEKRGNQLILEADKQSKKLLDDAKAKKEEMLKKI
jgi:hypothetical protein